MQAMSAEPLLDRLHARVVEGSWGSRLTAVTRGLLAVGYLRSGLIKVLGERFTTLPVDTPIGYFFDALHQTGMYYRFLGLSQVAASLLLLLPRTAPLGALLYLPISLNIFLITVSLGFQGTPFITGLMLLGAVYLVWWDYPRWKGVLFDAPAQPARPESLRVSGLLTLAVALGAQGAMELMRSH